MSSDRSGHFLAQPEDVLAFAWSAPMRELAGRLGITDVGLKKLLHANGIVTPPQGHWNRVHAGRKTVDPPAARPRGPGESGRIRLDGRFRGLVAETARIPEEGPFASSAVPESLAELRVQEQRAIGKISVARALTRPHAALAALLGREDQRRQKQAQSGWQWDGPRWGGPLAQRQLRLLDALFRALSGRGHHSWIRVSSGVIEIWCRIGESSSISPLAGRAGRGDDMIAPRRPTATSRRRRRCG